MILNKDCFFYKKSDFINRLPDISEESICYIADTQQIYVQGRYFECNVTRDIVESLIKSKGYLTAADLPTLTGGAASLPGEYVAGVTVDGYDVNVQKGKLSEIVVGTASKLETPRNISLSGDVSGSVSFDGSKDIVIDTTVLDDSHSHSNYVTLDTTQSITGEKTSIANPWAVRMTVDTSNAIDGLVWKNTSGTIIAGLNYHNTAKRIFINANTPEVTNIWEDAAGKYSLRIGWNELTYDNKPILHSGNYSSYTVTKTGGGASGTWGINITGSAGSVAWSNISGKPSSFTPSSHTHSYSQISGRPTFSYSNGTLTISA